MSYINNDNFPSKNIIIKLFVESMRTCNLRFLREKKSMHLYYIKLCLNTVLFLLLSSLSLA